MATYILLSSLNPGGLETLKERPDRLKEVNQEIERMGAKIKEQYAVLGPFDFVTILEAPDNITVSKISVFMGARGTVRIQTLPAVQVDEFIEGLKS
ncbi:MAG: GYD domain-containing protein [Actinomycetota bacterium]